jgi:hypothetical protein
VPPITELTRIEPVHLTRLEHQGVFTTGILLEVSETPTRRQTLADQVDADTNDVSAWRDEALMLNLAGFRAEQHRLFIQAGIEGIRDILGLSLGEFRARLDQAAPALVDPPDDLTTEGWWEQATPRKDDRGHRGQPVAPQGTAGGGGLAAIATQSSSSRCPSCRS